MTVWRHIVMDARGWLMWKLLRVALRVCDQRDPMKPALAEFLVALARYEGDIEHRPDVEGR